jgi:hypothetical protein
MIRSDHERIAAIFLWALFHGFNLLDSIFNASHIPDSVFVRRLAITRYAETEDPQSFP